MVERRLPADSPDRSRACLNLGAPWCRSVGSQERGKPSITYKADRFSFRSEISDETRGAEESEFHTEKIAFGFNADETGRIERPAKRHDHPAGIVPAARLGLDTPGLHRLPAQGVSPGEKAAALYSPSRNKQNMADLLARHEQYPEQVADP
jgi:hypothetical protein